MGRAAALATVVALAASGCGASESGTPAEDRPVVSIQTAALPLLVGWQGRTFTEAPSPPTLEAGNFVLPPPGYPHGNGEPWPEDAIFVRVADWTHGADPPPFRAQFEPGALPVELTERDLRHSVEGVPDDHAFAQRLVSIDGRLIEVVAEFGTRPVADTALDTVNQVLSALRVEPS